MSPTHRPARRVLCAALLLLAPLATAQSVPEPAEFYFDEDRATTQPIVAVRGEGEAVVDRLAGQIERDPRAYAAMLQLAGIAMKAGRQPLAQSLYQRAIDGLGRNNRLSRPARWHYGWDLHRAGDDAGALAQWSQLAEGPVRGQWQPSALALALWNLGRKQEAVKWYAAAVRTEPDRWASPRDIAALLPAWSAADRETLIEVQRAWAADPPRWP